MPPSLSESDLWFQLMPYGAVIQDSQLALIRANPAAVRLLGQSEEELRGRTPYDPRWHVIREDYSTFPAESRPSARVLASGQPVEGVVMGVFHPADRRYHWLKVSSYPVQDGRILTLFDDITETKAIEDRRRQELGLFADGPVVVLEWRGQPATLVSLSQNFSKVLGLNPDDFLGEGPSLWTLIHPDDRPGVDQAWQAALADPSVRSLGGNFRFRGGKGNWLHISYQTLIDRGGPGREPMTLAYWLDRTDETENLWRLSLTLEAARTGTWEWTREKDRVVVDSSWAGLVGAPLAEVGQMTLEDWRSLLHPGDLEAWDAMNHSVGSGEQLAFDLDVRLRHRAGHWLWTRVRGKVLDATPEGRPLRILGTQEDISDRVIAEEERSILSQVVEQGPSAVLLTDLNGTIEYVNRQFTALSGYTLDEVQGKTPRILKSPQTPPEVHLDLWTTLKAGRPWYGEFQNLRKDGTPYWVQASISPIGDASGKVYRYVGQHIDITARKRVEEASKGQYRFQVLLTQIAARLVDVRGEEASRALTEILGELGAHFRADRVFFGFLTGRGTDFNVRARWDKAGAPLPESHSLVDSPLWRKRILERDSLLSSALPCPVPWSSRPVAALLAVPMEGGLGDPGLLVLEAGSIRPEWNAEVQVSVTVVANTLAAFMKRVIDERELKRARLDAEQANRAKSDFLAHMSHEIRTPMNGILGLAELALGKPLDPEVRSLIEGVVASGENLLSLVNDILDVSKIEAGKLELETVGFSLKQNLTAALAPLRILAEKKGLDLQLRWTDSLVDSRQGDPTRLRQIITNLVANAIKFTPQGTITVSAEPGDGAHAVFFSVRDTGPGVDPDRQSRLFQRYSQTEASTSRRFGGTGLGLAICRELSERMGGSIGYRDAADPPGGIFWFSLPLLPSAAPLVSSIEASVTPDNPNAPSWNLRVLLVEDNPVNQQVAVGLLRRLGIDPVVASNGLEALDRLQAATFGLVLMDVQMPVLDGLAATRAIRRGEGGERNRNVPVVAMTANAMQSDREAALESGMNDYITKPVSAAKFNALFEKWNRPPEPLSPEARSRRTFDPREMRHRLQLEEEYVRQIIQLFLDDLPVRRKALVDALDQRRWEEVMRLAHTLKGTAANLVAEGVVETAQDLETAALRGDEEGIRKHQDPLIAEIDLLAAALVEFLR